MTDRDVSPHDTPMTASHDPHLSPLTNGTAPPPEIQTSAVSEGAGDTPAQEPPKKQTSLIREVIETLILALIIFVAVRAVVLNFRVEGLSMSPNFDNREMLLVNRNA